MNYVGAFDHRQVARQVGDGKSILRAMANAAIARWQGDLRGTVLDLASGEGTSAMRSLAPAARWVGLDLGGSPDLRADLTAPLPLRNGVADAALCLWFLYIAPEPIPVLREFRRVLRPGGALLLATPLVFPVNPEPRDLWRFTEDGLRFLLGEAGFQAVEVIPLGGRWASAVYLLEPFLRPRRVVAGNAARAALWLDDWASRRRPRMAPNPVGYLVRAVA